MTNKHFPRTGFLQKSDCGFPDFSRTKLLLFPDFSRYFVHLYMNINITQLAFKRWNFLYNVFFYSTNRMRLKFLNSELQMLCVVNCKKINKCISNQQRNRHLYFPGQHYSFQEFFHTSIPMIIFKTFQGLENFYIKFQDFPYFSRICTNPARTIMHKECTIKWTY